MLQPLLVVLLGLLLLPSAVSFFLPPPPPLSSHLQGGSPPGPPPPSPALLLPPRRDPDQPLAKLPSPSAALSSLSSSLSSLYHSIRGTTLSVTPVTSVSAPNSTLLPPEIVLKAARLSGLHGGYMNSTTVSQTAKLLKSYYESQGYVLASVSSATISPSGAVELTTTEPRVGSPPVAVSFKKEMIVDPSYYLSPPNSTAPPLLSFAQFQRRQARLRPARPLARKDLNTTYAPCKGRARPGLLASSLGLVPGRAFRWDADRWARVSGAGLFEQAETRPVPDGRGGVTLEIVASSRPERNLEYGVAKSLTSGEFEGEATFEHRNVFGGGEVASAVFRRGARDPQGSYRARYRNDRLGAGGGHEVEAYSEYIGEGAGGLFGKEQEPRAAPEGEERQPSTKQGAALTLADPLSLLLRRSSATLTAERTLTDSGEQELISSVAATLGPSLASLPLGGAGSLSASITGGSKLPHGSPSPLPFTAATFVAKELLPVTRSERLPAQLACRQTIHAASRGYPRHEARAAAARNRIRGYPGAEAGEPPAATVAGTEELRVPLPFMDTGVAASVGVCSFADFSFGRAAAGERKWGEARYAVGIGVRGTLAGALPVSADLTINKEGDVRTSIGFGGDWGLGG